VNRIDIIDKIGAKYNVGNIESGEFSYPKALKSINKNIKEYQKASCVIFPLLRTLKSRVFI